MYYILTSFFLQRQQLTKPLTKLGKVLELFLMLNSTAITSTDVTTIFPAFPLFYLLNKTELEIDPVNVYV